MPVERQPERVDTNLLIEALEQGQREEIAREARRAEFAEELARYRWHIANRFHRTDTDQPLDFKNRSFQPPIYRDSAMRLVVMGATQWGKTEFLIVTAAVMAAAGLRVFYVFDKFDKRDRLVASRMDPTFKTVPVYRKWMEEARKRNRVGDSLKFKHLGHGYINFVGANTPKDFSSHAADVVIIDEHQLCDLQHLQMVDNRLSGSDYRYKIIVGNPRTKGGPENPNLDWEYHNTCQFQWHVRCPHCQQLVVLDWWRHVVKEERNRAGGILSIEPRNKRWRPSSQFDIQPICDCGGPINRLVEGTWVAMNPEHPDHGYQLSNLYNVNRPLREMFDSYKKAMHNPATMANFHNDMLGIAYDAAGTRITDKMLSETSTGDLCRLPSYAFHPASTFGWRT